MRRMGSVTHTGVTVPEIRPEASAVSRSPPQQFPHIPTNNHNNTESSGSSTQKLREDVNLVESQVRMLNEMLTEFGDPQHDVTEDDVQLESVGFMGIEF